MPCSSRHHCYPCHVGSLTICCGRMRVRLRSLCLAGDIFAIGKTSNCRQWVCALHVYPCDGNRCLAVSSCRNVKWRAREFWSAAGLIIAKSCSILTRKHNLIGPSSQPYKNFKVLGSLTFPLLLRIAHSIHSQSPAPSPHTSKDNVLIHPPHSPRTQP